jgi:TusA-related sulfurtransferase
MSSETIDLLNVEASKVVDARSSACPGPLLEAKKGMGGVKVGEILEIWSGEEATRKNLSMWCKKTGHEFMGFIGEGGYDRLFILRKK